jgi:ABC-type branched-subunit amino acid transport system substrate-binding protein
VIALLFTSFPAPLAAQEKPKTSSSVALGIAVPTSGKYGPLGKQLVESARLAAAETGVELVVADTEGDPKKAVEAVATLAKDPRVIAIVGPIGQRESRAAGSAAQRFGIPLFTLSTAEDVNRSGGWVFRVRSAAAEQASEMAIVARRELKHETAAILYPKTEYGRDAAHAFARRFIEQGGTITIVANYPEDTTDFRDVLDVIVAKKVYLGKKGTVGRWRTDASGFARIGRNPRVDFDALFIPDFHHRIARLLPFLPVAGIQNGDGGEGVGVQLLGLSGWQGKTMEFSGGSAAGALYLDTYAGESAGGRAEEFSRTFESATGRRPVDVEAETFDIVWLLGKLASSAVAAAGGNVTEGGRAALVRRLPRKREWTGVTGSIRFGPSGEPLRDLGVYRFDADGFVAPAF